MEFMYIFSILFSIIYIIGGTIFVCEYKKSDPIELKAAYKQAELNRDAGQDLNGISIDGNSILNAYPKELIK